MQEAPAKESPFPLPPYVAFPLAGLGGVIQALAYPRVGLYPLSFACLAPLLLAIHGRAGKGSLFYGWIYGLALGLASFSWLSGVMSGYGGLGPWGGALVLLLLAAFLGLYQGLFAWLLAGHDWLQRPFPFLLKAALYWAGLDWLKNWVFTGFNWTPIAGSLAAAPRLLGVADLIGTYGLGYLVALSGCALGLAAIMWLRGRGKKEWLPMVAAPLAVVMVLLAYGAPAYMGQEGRLQEAQARDFAVLQASVDQNYKWDSAYRGEILARYGILARQASTYDPFLVVWSETAAPFVFGNDPYESEWVMGLLEDLRIPMLVGLTAVAYDKGLGRSTRNRAWLLYPGRRLGPHYDKLHLVPFGEYVPFSDTMPFLKAPFLQGVLGAAGNFSPGEGIAPIAYEGVSMGIIICFESIFPYLSRLNAEAGADLLVVTTNDAWFGDSFAPDQHFAHSILRAVETRRPLLRAANNGISGVILPSGRVLARSSLNEVKAFIYQVPLPRGQKLTPYVRFGYLLAPLFAILTTIAILLKAVPPLGRLARRLAGKGPGAEGPGAPPGGQGEDDLTQAPKGKRRKGKDG
ncbi:MAG: apolipoprotein N-acyltransferase [Deltaproteobacteria bacterium]|jgi:apolipoprotein N-acyltransferase|nr:apolipoprotein N-acyltransferase [Deltaproteobacteria bacterium]